MAISNLKDVYIDQLQDIYSACNQSEKATRELKEAANDSGLKDALDAGVKGIQEGKAMLAEVIKGHGADPTGEFCKGMEGLVKEARSHGIEENISDPAARDAMIITQYQRMAHYAIAGYGCLVGFAEQLKLSDEKGKLQKALDETAEGDKRMTKLAESGINKAAA